MEKLRSVFFPFERACTRLYECFLGIDTITLPSGALGVETQFDDRVHYEPVEYRLIPRLLRPLQVAPSDVVFDVGCGLGRFLCVIGRMSVRKCVGIEITPQLASFARLNAEKLRFRKAPIEVRTEDAALADYDEGTIFILSNPFGAKTMEVVLDRIEKSFSDSPRNIRLAYATPVHEDVFRSRDSLVRYESVSFRSSRLKVSYWTFKA